MGTRVLGWGVLLSLLLMVTMEKGLRGISRWPLVRSEQEGVLFLLLRPHQTPIYACFQMIWFPVVTLVVSHRACLLFVVLLTTVVS